MRIQNLLVRATLIALVGTMGLSACTTAPTSSSRVGDSAGMYRVRSGDTLSLIARANGVSVNQLMAWNGLSNPNYLEVGWRLRVRSNASGSASVTAPTPTPTPGRAQATISDPEIKVNTAITNNVSWNWPSNNGIIRNFDGNLTNGVVFGGERGSPVLAASSGEVIYAGNSLRGYGNMVVIKHNDTWSSVYANNEELFVRQGQRVGAGQKIASQGDSDASRTQLYFEVRQNSKPIDPLRILPGR